MKKLILIMFGLMTLNSFTQDIEYDFIRKLKTEKNIMNSFVHDVFMRVDSTITSRFSENDWPLTGRVIKYNGTAQCTYEIKTNIEMYVMSDIFKKALLKHKGIVPTEKWRAIGDNSYFINCTFSYLYKKGDYYDGLIIVSYYKELKILVITIIVDLPRY